jgi:transglutaminase-like putative cysteine protease
MRRRGGSSHVKDFVQPVVDEAGGETTAFLTKFVLFMHEHFDKIERETGAPLTPDETIAWRKGACRDLAVVFIEGCRAVGLAARFVSGYMWNEGQAETHDLHAWVEVFIPGGGWRGFDPSIGLAVTDQHVAVATAANSVDAAPVSGTLRGTGNKSKLECDVSIDLCRDS